MADLSRKTASIYINHQPAQEALQALQGQADKLTEKIKKGEAAGKNMVNEIKKLNTVKNDMAAVQKQIDSGLRPSFNQLQTTVSRLRNELKRMSEDAPGYAAKFKAYQQASTHLQKVSTSLSSVNAESSKLGQFFGSFGGLVAGGGFIAAGAAVIGFLKGSVDEALQAQEQTARLQNTLDNLGKSDAFDRITSQSDRLAKSLGYLDNDDINGVFESLLSYGKLTEAQMSKLTPVIIDFAAKTRKSLPEATSEILKALEGNAKGLKEYGINIKDAGTEEERFNVITTELAGKVKGAAETFSGTFAGSLAKSKQEIKDVQEEIGNNLIPVFALLIKTLAGGIRIAKDFFSELMKSSTWSSKGPVQSIIDDLYAKEGDKVKEFSDTVAQSFISAPLEVQEKVLLAAKSKLVKAQKDIDAFIKKSNDPNNKVPEVVRVNQEQLLVKEFMTNQQIYLKLQANLDQAKQDAKDKADRDASEKLEAQRQKDIDAAKKSAAEATAEYKRLLKEFQDFNKNLSNEFDNTFLSDLALKFKKIEDEANAELASLKNFYDKKIIDQKKYNELSIKVEEIRFKKLRELRNEIAGNVDIIKPEKTDLADIIAKNTVPAQITANIQRQIADAKADGELGNAKAKLDANLKILDLERAQELLNTDITLKQKAALQKKYDDARQKLVLAYYTEQAQKIIDAGQQALEVVELFNEAADARDQARIDEKNAAAELDKQKAQRLLNGKLIDQQEYDRRVRNIDEKNRRETAKLKKQQFERDKRAEVIQAEISGAQAILTALKTSPFFVGLAMAALATIKTFEQINAIKSKKAPEFGKGGIPDGPLHSQGGMPVINPRTGKKVAEIEGGEPILSRKTYKNNKQIIDQLLHASMYGNGATIKPFWQTRPYQGMNYAAINRTIDKVHHYDRGGIFQAETNNPSSTGLPINDILQTLNSIDISLRTPQKNYVVIGEVNAANEVLTNIKSQTTMSRK